MNARAIEKEALELPVEKRAKLAQRLLESLEDLSEAEAEKLWLQKSRAPGRRDRRRQGASGETRRARTQGASTHQVNYALHPEAALEHEELRGAVSGLRASLPRGLSIGAASRVRGAAPLQNASSIRDSPRIAAWFSF
jgi:hypothetical protein